MGEEGAGDGEEERKNEHWPQCVRCTDMMLIRTNSSSVSAHARLLPA